jgi:type IV pilus assembly protein PilF
MRPLRLTVLLAATALVAGCGQNPPAATPAAAVNQPLQRETVKMDAKRLAELDTQKRADRSRIHTELAAGYLELGNLGVALDEAGEALKGNPDYAQAYGVYGLIYMQLRDDEKADASFRRALKIAPDDPDINNNYGFYLCARKREKEGIERLMAAVKNPLYKTPERAWSNAGSCALQRGDTAAAEDYFKSALRASPGQIEALYNMAVIEYGRGNTIDAKSYLTQLVRRMNNPNAQILWLGVRIERKLGDRNSEASYGAQLRRSFPDSREALLMQAGRFE